MKIKPHKAASAMKTQLTLIATALVAAAFSPVAAEGVASSMKTFELARAGSESYITTTNAIVSKGDVVRGSESAVQVEFPGGNSILVDKGGEASLSENSAVELRKGAMIAGGTGAEAVALSYQDLNVARTAAGKETSAVFMGERPDGMLQVTVFDGFYSITNDTTKEGVASLGSGDAVVLRKVGQTWEVVNSVGKDPLTGLDMVDSGALNEDSERVGAFWWSDAATVILLGAGGAGLASWLVYEALDHEKDDEDNDEDEPTRRRFSPTI